MKYYILILISFTCLSPLYSQILYTQTVEDLKSYKKNSTDIIKEANDIVVSKEVFSIVNKTMFEVSKDKHDYVSMASYWWPNPKTENGLPYVVKDGELNEEVYENYRDFKQLVEFSKSIKTLGIAYYLSRDSKYILEAERKLRGWFVDDETKMNPNMNHSQFIKGINQGRIEGIIDARYFIDVIEGIDLLSMDGGFNRSLGNSLQNWFRQFLIWMETSTIGKRGFQLKNNIATSYHLQRMVYNTFIGKSNKAIEVYEGDFSKLFDNQIDSKGAQPLELKRTKAYGYSTSNLGYLKKGITLASNLRGADVHLNGNRHNKVIKAQEFIDNRLKK